jgi:hypothetical protein
MIDLLFVCGIIGLLSGIALPRLIAAKGSAMSASAISTLRVLSSAEVTFAITCGNGFYAPSLPALGALPPGATEGFVKADFAAGMTITKSGYQFQLTATPFGGAPDTCNMIGPGLTGLAFKVAGDPLDVANNSRYFGTNAGSTIWEDQASLWAGMPEFGDPPAGHPLQR